MTVQLALLPEHHVRTIVVGTTVRKSAAILRAHFASIERQELPGNTRLLPIYVDDGCDIPARAELDAFVARLGGEVLHTASSRVPDFDDSHPVSHQWSDTAMQRVGAHKDAILARARALNADAVWLCDADLICDNTTLASLSAVDSPIASAVYWTRWARGTSETQRIHAAPQVWLSHPYGLAGNGWTESEFRDRLARRTLTPVRGYGACTLISRHALHAGVGFARLPDIQPVGLMAGEDRHFCLRAERLHIPAVADPWADIFHVYHAAEDTPRIPEMEARLSTPHPRQVTLGALVSLKIQPLEPLPHGGGGWTMIPPQFVRGRVGALPLVPELEEAVYGLERSKDVTVPVHFPAHYPITYYAGKRRLLRMTLIDTKPYGFAPVLEDEMFVGPRSGAALRTVDYTQLQLDGMREVARGTN